MPSASSIQEDALNQLKAFCARNYPSKDPLNVILNNVDTMGELRSATPILLKIIEEKMS